jgi:3-oxoacyl-[acyl-carrier-protein] synthase-3
VLAYSLGADGSLTDLLCVKKGTAKEPTSESLGSPEHALKMNGKEIFRLAVRAGIDSGNELCSAVGVSPPEIDYLMFHQANQRILSSVGKQLGLKEEQVLSNVAKYGNTSAASIPILLAESVEKGVVKPGQLLLLSAFGGGVTWGGAMVRY